MNIKEHIEAGHYPLDDKGRALVPFGNGGTVVIYATDNIGAYPIVGRPMQVTGAYTWSEEGALRTHGPHSWDLLPPPPRKVEVKAVAAINGQGTMSLIYRTHEEMSRVALHADERIVELTGIYEEPWE